MTFLVGFAGPGDINTTAINDLLDDWLPEDCLCLVPSVTRRGTGIHRVKTWLKDVEIPMETCDAEKMVEQLMLRGSQGPTTLALLWQDGDKICEMLLEQATKSSIPCRDLTSALEEITYEETDFVEVNLGHETPNLMEEYPSETGAVFETRVVEFSAAEKLTEAMKAYILSVIAEFGSVALLPTVGRAEAPAPTAPPPGIFIKSTDGTYHRPRPGKLRKGEEKVTLTSGEVTALMRNGLLDMGS